MESSIENRARLLPLCHWIDELRDFDLIVNNHESLTVNDVLLILLKLTSRVERRLGDVSIHCIVLHRARGQEGG